MTHNNKSLIQSQQYENTNSEFGNLENTEKNAILYFQNALKLDSKNNDVRYNLAQAFASDRQYDNSITTYKELLKTSPENYDGYIELAKVYMAKGDNETAAKYLEFVQIKKPDFKASVIKSLLQTIK